MNRNHFYILLLWLCASTANSQIHNGDFSDPVDATPAHWQVRTLSGTAASVITHEDGNRVFSLHTEAISASVRPWDVRLVQPRLSIQRNQPIRLQARVRVQDAESGILRLAVFNAANVSLVDSGALLISNEWQTISVQIPAVDLPLPLSLIPEEVLAYFMLAYTQNIGARLEIDDVQFDLRSGMVVNPGFDMQAPGNLPAGWEVTSVNNNPVYVTSDIGIEYPDADITDVLVTEVNSLASGANPWAQRVIQRGVKVRQGMRYRFSFDVWSSGGPASFRAAIFTPSLVSQFDSQAFAIDASPRNISFEFIGGESPDVMAYFMYAYQQNIGQRIFLDNVHIEEVNDPNRIANGDFASRSASGNATGWTFTGASAVGGVVENSPADRYFAVGVASGEAIANPWAIRLVQSNIRLEPETYTMSLRVRSNSRPAHLRVALFDTGLTPIFDSQQLTIDSDWQTLTFPFQLSQTTHVMPYLMFGYEGNNDEPIYVDDVEIRSENYLRNSDFSLIDQLGQALYWQPWTDGTGAVDFSYDAGTAVMTVLETGSPDMTYSLGQHSFVTEPGATYRLTFDAQINRNDVELRFGLLGTFFQTQILAAGAWQTSEADFVASDTYGMVIFFPSTAQIGDRLSLRNIRLTRVD